MSIRKALGISLVLLLSVAASCGRKDRPVIAVVPKSQASILVTIFDSGINTDKYLSYVSTDNYKGGALAAERLGAILPAGGEIAVIGTIPGSVSTTERENGFRDTVTLKFPQLKIAAFRYGMADRAKSLAVAEDILTAHPDLAGIFCSNESGTVGAVQGARSKGLILQNPFRMGYLGVKTIVDRLHGTVPPKRIDTGATAVTADNLNQPAIQELVNPPIDKYLR
ncbi:MAG: RbsB5 [Acidobacteria bacterium]|nr:RbsB5 [Acidobacteriota bacterium]